MNRSLDAVNDIVRVSETASQRCVPDLKFCSGAEREVPGRLRRHFLSLRDQRQDASASLRPRSFRVNAPCWKSAREEHKRICISEKLLGGVTHIL